MVISRTLFYFSTFLIGILGDFTPWSRAPRSQSGKDPAFLLSLGVCATEKGQVGGEIPENAGTGLLCLEDLERQKILEFSSFGFLKMAAHGSPLDGSRRPSRHAHPNVKTFAAELLAKMILGSPRQF